MFEDLTIIIPTRNTISSETLNSLPYKAKLSIGIDNGKGQTQIRYDLAIKANTRYLLILDDDVVIKQKDISKMLSILKKGSFTSVCGRFNPIANNKFSKSILRYKQNPPSFITTGITMWHRGDFLAVMYDVPKDCPKNVGDLVIKNILDQQGRNYIKLNDIKCNHNVNVTRLSFFKYRYNAGVGLAWYHKRYTHKGYYKLMLKMLLGIPLSRNQGVLIYRLSTFLGMFSGGLKY